ncbi:Uma2 family endonuclease [Thermomonospora amylolytica]|uniref:Uma2 family endonuclease n=1 Tax=Thermomonospora amylolytica TaxID=1411117 RepID=UPI000E6C65A1|nr:Uma2 family endonuclease [Thermomonospora amylolytica]
MTIWHEHQHEPITWEAYLDIDEETRRDLELVDGYVVPREQRGRDHQKVATRLSLALEREAVAEMRRTGRAECYETNTEVDVPLWERSPTARKPDAVLHRCLPEFEQLAAEHCLIVVEVLSTWSDRRDRVYKMADYADAGIPHYWLVQFDKVGAVAIERYALTGGRGPYTHIGTTHRDMGPEAVHVTSPFSIRVLWEDLEVAPKV